MSKLTNLPPFTKHEMERILSMTMRIKNGKSVPTWEFDSIIRLIDKKEPDMHFDKMFTYAKYYDII